MTKKTKPETETVTMVLGSGHYGAEGSIANPVKSDVKAWEEAGWKLVQQTKEND